MPEPVDGSTLPPPPDSDVVRFHVVSVGASAEDGDTNTTGDIPGLGSSLILRNGAILTWGSGGGTDTARGINVAVVDPATTQLAEPARTFDTFGTRETRTAMEALEAYLGEIPLGLVVVLTIVDEAGLNYTPFDDGPDGMEVSRCDFWVDEATQNVLSQLRALGASQIDDYCYRDSYAVAAIKGAGEILGEAQMSGAPATLQFSLPIAN
jgi:hypothetical protein